MMMDSCLRTTERESLVLSHIDPEKLVILNVIIQPVSVVHMDESQAATRCYVYFVSIFYFKTASIFLMINFLIKVVIFIF